MLTRRDFMAELAAASAAMVASIAAAPIAEAAAVSRAPRRPVVGFHMDQPYLDVTGSAVPYLPPSGLRSADPVAHLSEENFRRAHAYA